MKMPQALKVPQAARMLRERAAALRRLAREQMDEEEPMLADDLSRIAADLEERANRLESAERP